MSIVYKAKFTRPTLNHKFFIETITDYTNYYWTSIEKTWSDDLIKNYTYEEIISWDDVFQRKNELRHDLKFIIESNNLSSTMMKGYGPSFNPFSLTLTELWEYHSWEDAMIRYDQVFTEENMRFFVETCKFYENTYISEHYIDGIKVDDWISRVTI